MKYKNYTIEPMDTIYSGGLEYKFEFVHDEYDGAPDSYDGRLGIATSVENAKEQIDDICNGNY
jgi:hypothetical protein